MPYKDKLKKAAAQKRYREAHKERLAAYDKRYRATHREARQAYDREYYQQRRKKRGTNGPEPTPDSIRVPDSTHT
ncbi:MAG: hypothetical protein JSR29_15855 [Nitrospira sp.]|nr:hypothetical protein [Nitrospira sp.]